MNQFSYITEYDYINFTLSNIQNSRISEKIAYGVFVTYVLNMLKKALSKTIVLQNAKRFFPVFLFTFIYFCLLTFLTVIILHFFLIFESSCLTLTHLICNYKFAVIYF